jgi:hypothetical protein
VGVLQREDRHGPGPAREGSKCPCQRRRKLDSIPALNNWFVALAGILVK